MEDSERRRIDRLRQAGGTFVWMYAPGLFYPGRKPERSLEHSAEILGFSLSSQTADHLAVDMKLTPRGSEYFAGFDPERVFGSFERPKWNVDPATGHPVAEKPSKVRLAERFFGIESAGAEVLARYVDGGAPSIMMRRTGNATNIWIGSVMAPADLLRCVARHAGAHLYCDADEIVYANRSFLAIHTATSGRKNFRLRRQGDVTELFSGKILARNVQEFPHEMDAGSTRLYFLGRADDWT